MSKFPSDESYLEFERNYERESARKEKLLTLFEMAEAEERRRKRFPRKSKKKRKYEKVVRDEMTVVKIKADRLELVGTSRQTFSPLQVTSEIAQLLREGDSLSLTIGLEDKIWRLIFVSMIGSYMEDMDCAICAEEDRLLKEAADSPLH